HVERLCRLRHGECDEDCDGDRAIQYATVSHRIIVDGLISSAIRANYGTKLLYPATFPGRLLRAACKCSNLVPRITACLEVCCRRPSTPHTLQWTAVLRTMPT